MKSLKDVIKSKKFDSPKNVSKEYQSYGVWLAEQLDDTEHKSLYIKLAKECHRTELVKAYSFAIDYPEAKSKAKIFMWKLRDQGVFKGGKSVKSKQRVKSKK